MEYSLHTVPSLGPVISWFSKHFTDFNLFRSIVSGYDGIPSDRPVLFVGNHQTLAPDTPVLVEELLRKKGILLRGLAHPAVSQVICTHSPVVAL